MHMRSQNARRIIVVFDYAAAQYNPSDKRHGPAKYPELPAPPPAVIVVSAPAKKDN